MFCDLSQTTRLSAVIQTNTQKNIPTDRGHKTKDHKQAFSAKGALDYYQIIDIGTSQSTFKQRERERERERGGAGIERGQGE